MTDTVATAAPAGWYDDPGDPLASFRWWSGAAWTEHTSPKAPVASSAQQFAPVIAPALAQPSPYGEANLFLPQFSRDPMLPDGGSPPVAPFDYGTPATGSSQTLGIWLIAFLPLMNVAVFGILLSIAVAANTSVPPLASYLVAVGLSWWFGWLDSRELARRGYRAPSLLWMLLFPPLAYLIARGRMLRAQGATVWPPELVYVGSIVIGGFIAGIIAVAASLAAPHQAGVQYYAGTFGDTGVVTSPSVESMISSSTQGTLSADCSQAQVERGAYFTCFGSQPASGSQLLIDVHVCGCGDVYFTYDVTGASGTSALPSSGLPSSGLPTFSRAVS